MCMCVVSRKARREVALDVDDIYGATNGKYRDPFAVTSNSSFASYSSVLGASIQPGYHDVMSVYEHPRYPNMIDNDNSSSSCMDREYATTLQIRRTAPPLAAVSCGELWTCPVHGRLLSLIPQRAWRGAGRLYEVAARLDTLHEDVTPSAGADAEAALAPAAVTGATNERDVLPPFYHELEPTAVDLIPCRHH